MLGVALTVEIEVESRNVFFDLSCIECIGCGNWNAHEVGSPGGQLLRQLEIDLYHVSCMWEGTKARPKFKGKGNSHLPRL